MPEPLTPASPGPGLEEARTLIHSEPDDAALQTAIDILGAHLDRQPGDGEAQCLLSEACLAAGMPDESLDAALAAVKAAAADDPEPPFRAGLALYELAAVELGAAPDGRQRIDPMFHFIEAVLEIPPLRNQELAFEALEMFLESCRRGPVSGGPFFWAGICLLGLGHRLEALEAFQNASDCEGSLEARADGWFLQGLTFEELDQAKEASEAYQIALAHDADHRGAAIRLQWLDPDARDGFLEPTQVAELLGSIQTELAERREALAAPTADDREDRDRSDEDGAARIGGLAAACSGTLDGARRWASSRLLDPDRLESFLVYHGAACDCEVLLNLESRLGLDDERDASAPADPPPVGAP